MRVPYLIVSDVNYPQASSLESILAKRCTCTQGRILRYTKHRLRTRQNKMIGQREEMPHKNDSNYHKGVTLSLSLPVCLSTHTLFPSNKHFMCFTTFHLYVEIHFYTADGPGPCHWPLVPGGLVAKIQCSQCCCLTSVSGWEPKACFKLLQDGAT